MKLSLSARLIEVTGGEFSMGLSEFFDMAVKAGYEGVHPRDGQTDPFLKEGRSDELLEFFTARGLGCSMLWGRVDGSRSYDEDLTEKKMDFLKQVGCDLLMIGYPTDLDLVRTCCDRAAQKGITAMIACHVASLFEDLDKAGEFVKKVDRPNLALNIDPLNIYLAGQDYGLSTLEGIKDYVRLVNVQGGVLDEQGDQVGRRYYSDEKPRFRRAYLCEEDAMDIPQFISDLKAIGYDGYVNVLEPYSEGRDLSEIAARTARMLKDCIGG